MKPKDSFASGIQNIKEIPLTKICRKLKANRGYCKKREQKAMNKGFLNTLEITAS